LPVRARPPEPFDAFFARQLITCSWPSAGVNEIWIKNAVNVLSERNEPKDNAHMSFYVYILRNPYGQLYVGQTINLSKRLVDHQNGRIKYTRDHHGFELVYFEVFRSRAESMRREKQIKGWSRKKKLVLISKHCLSP